MDKETKRKAKITLIGIIGIIILLIGVSFAAFSSDLAGVQIQSMQTGCLKVDMTDNGSVNMTNEAPTSDEDGLTKTPYTYTLTNTCTTDAFYTTTINVMNSSNLDNISKIKVSLEGDSYLAPTIESNLEEMESVDTSETNISKTYKLDEGYLKVGETKTFNLRTWIDYDVTSITGGLENKVIVLSEAREGQTIGYDTNTSGYDVLKLSTMLTNISYKDVATENGIIKVEENDNVKYYFRGNPNNNLTFAGLNFKVLSTNSDGSVNIVLNDTIGTSTYSNIETTLNNWYTQNITEEEQYVKTDATYCVETENSDGDFLAKIRVENANPSITCNGDTLTKVGLLTADDLMYAGAVTGKANTSFYLTTASSYYTSTYNGPSSVYAYTAANSIASQNITGTIGIKPVITLKSNVMIKGEGTSSSPFYVSGTYGEEKPDTTDKTAPTISYARVDERWSKENKSIKIVGTDNAGGSGIGGYLVKSSNTKPASTDSGWEATSSRSYTTVNTYDNGTYYVFVKDNAGNVSEGKEVVIDKVDKVAPSCTIRINPNGTAAAYKTLSIMSEETNIDLNGYSWDHTESKADVIKVTENGVYTAHITDLAGNQGSCSGTVITLEPQDTSGANEPVLDQNMIAVYYDEANETWRKADSTNKHPDYKWYDYDNKMWANSVTVTSSSRSTYLNAALGTEIPMEDLLTMQVWVPRYKYKVWNYNADGTVTSQPQEIEIVFEEGKESTGDITCTDTISGTDGAKSESCKINGAECTDSTCNNKYYTHPAFTFGSEELTGFWIGKFELTGTIDNITTKPNLSSLRNRNVSTFETNIIAMNDSGNQYGFNTTTDTHMIKNMEWGAVAYLSHSKYGTCTNGTCEEVYINNSSGYYTGRSGATADADDTSTGDYQYNEKRQVDEIVEGTGTESTLSTITNDATYPWAVSSGLYTSTNKTDSTTSNLTFTFDVTSKSVLTFDWSVSSESASYDYVYYTITKDGTALSDTGTSTKIGGTTYGTSGDAMTYLNVVKILEAGSYELTFTYRKDSSSSSGTDTAYIKNVKLIEGVEVNTTTVKGGEMASTTHNIYGVYDMSGGAYEYVMGNIVSSDGTTMMSGNSSSYNSGYTGIIYNSGNYTSYTGTYSYPDMKYYDKYSFGTSNSQRIRSKLGDGIKEVLNTSSRGWYSDYSFLASSNNPWFNRGGDYRNGSDAGAFSSYNYYGYASTNRSSRLVITP